MIVFVYAILNIWAIHQIQLDTSEGSLLTAIKDYKFSSSLTEGEVGTTISLRNPTVIPVLVGSLNYDAKYGSNQLAQGQSGFIFIMPYSTLEVPVNIKVYYDNLAKGVISGIANAFLGNRETLTVNMYTHLFVVDIPLKSYSY